MGGNKMSRYIPDRWVIVKIVSPVHGTCYKILASWYGGFTGSDSWKLSSGNIGATLEDGVYTFPQFSTSIYKCYKNSYGTSGYTASVYNSWLKRLTPDLGTMEILPEDFDITQVFTNE